MANQWRVWIDWDRFVHSDWNILDNGLGFEGNWGWWVKVIFSFFSLNHRTCCVFVEYKNGQTRRMELRLCAVSCSILLLYFLLSWLVILHRCRLPVWGFDPLMRLFDRNNGEHPGSEGFNRVAASKNGAQVRKTRNLTELNSATTCSELL